MIPPFAWQATCGLARARCGSSPTAEKAVQSAMRAFGFRQDVEAIVCDGNGEIIEEMVSDYEPHPPRIVWRSRLLVKRRNTTKGST